MKIDFEMLKEHGDGLVVSTACVGGLASGIIYNELYPISGDYYFILKILNDSKIKTCFIDKYITVMRDGGDSTKLSNILQKLIEDIKSNIQH